MSTVRPAFIALLLAGCASTTSTRTPAGSAPQSTGQFTQIAITPLSDLNLIRTKIPALLQEARSYPYGPPRDGTCPGLAGEVGKLDVLLGADLDAPPANKDQGAVEKGAEFVGDAAVGAVRNTAEDIVPFRSWIRRLTGAERHAREVAAAIRAGHARRAFLKGLGLAGGCPPPAGPQPLLKSPEPPPQAEQPAWVAD